MAIGSNSSRRIRDTDLVVSEEQRPGWVPANDRLVAVGDEVIDRGHHAARVVGHRGRNVEALDDVAGDGNQAQRGTVDDAELPLLRVADRPAPLGEQGFGRHQGLWIAQ